MSEETVDSGLDITKKGKKNQPKEEELITGFTFISLKKLSSRLSLHVTKKYGNIKKTQSDWEKAFTEDKIIK